MSVTENAPTPTKFGDKLTSLQRDIICVLSGCDRASGKEVKQELEQYYETTIHRGRLYPNLDTLVEYEFVAKSPATGRSNNYELTELGRRAYRRHQDWRSSWVEFGDSTNESGESEMGGGE